MAPLTRDEEQASFREMTIADLALVEENEKKAYTHPWTQGLFRDSLQAGDDCWLLLLDRQIVGHGVLSVVAEEGHLLNVCVHPDFQGSGLGRQLVRHLLARAAARRARAVFLEVRSSNEAACHLYEDLGFNEIGTRKDYYPAFRGREDARVFAKELL